MTEAEIRAALSRLAARHDDALMQAFHMGRAHGLAWAARRTATITVRSSSVDDHLLDAAAKIEFEKGKALKKAFPSD